jgi:Leucine-rich repeat (LRR) protein
MKIKNLAQQMARIFLVIIIPLSSLFATQQTASAKSLAAPFTDCASQSEIPTTECDALLALYNNTTGASWDNHTGWLETDTPCSWFGVSCTGGHVTSLMLGIQNGSGWVGNGLVGTIPTEIGDLTSLVTLVLSDNKLSGSIPTQLQNLTSLATLNLDRNMLSGSIPPELGNLTNLTSLDLSLNLLTGSIPTQLGNLTHLTKLALSNNQLTGSIPTQLGNLTVLIKLYLYRNQLSGSIPAQLGNVRSLQELLLHNNQLTGSIPTTLGNITALQSLWLDDNQLTGPIPTTFGNLTNLTSLIMYYNLLTGPIPTQLGNLTKLTKLDLSHNFLSGTIPTQLGNLTKLTHLHLGANNLSGSIPAQLGNLTNLTLLIVYQNNLSGSLPPQIGNLIKLQWLWLNNTNLAGTIPTSFINLTSLTHLTLTCRLTSTDPKVISFIDKLLSPGWNNGCFSPIGNDDFNNAITIWPVPYTHSQSAFATTSADDPVFTCGTRTQGQSTVWYKFSSHTTGILTINTFGSNYDTMLAAWKGSRGFLLNVACNDDTSGHGYQSQISIDIVANKVYYIEVAGYGGSGTTVLNASVSAGQPTPTPTPITKTKTFTSVAVQDGWILESSESSNKGGTLNSSATTFNLGDSKTKKQYRDVLSFNTGAVLPDTAVITGVTLKIKENAVIGNQKPTTIFQGLIVDMKRGFFGMPQLELRDFQAAADKSYGPFTNLSTVNNWYVINLTAAKRYINKLATNNGLTQIRLRFKLDDNNDAIANYLSLFSGDTLAANRPQLIIQYYVP